MAIKPRSLRAACRAWEAGGCLALGRWLAKRQQPFTVRQYGELVARVRHELGDWTDYSQEDGR